MTTESLDLAGLSEEPSIPLKGWFRPESVRLDAGDLVFGWPEELMQFARLLARSTEVNVPGPTARDLVLGSDPEIDQAPSVRGLPRATSSRQMLIRFSLLHQRSDEDVAAFARRFGPLEGDPIYLTPGFSGFADAPTPVEMFAPLTERQRVSWWRRNSSRVARTLDHAAALRNGDAVPTGSDSQGLEDLDRTVNDYLRVGRVRPHLWRDVRDHVRIEFVGIGLTAAIGTQLLAAVAIAPLKLCQGCAGPVPKGSRIFCSNCRKAGIPGVREQERRRAREREKKMERERDGQAG